VEEMNAEEIKKELALETELYEYQGEDRIISSHEMREIIKAHGKAREFGLLTFRPLPTYSMDSFLGS
jgi:hypothetical protein